MSELEHRLGETEERLQSLSSIEDSLNQLRHDADTLKGDLGEARREKDHLSEELGNTKKGLEESQNSRKDVDSQLEALLQEINELKAKSQNLDQLHNVSLCRYPVTSSQFPALVKFSLSSFAGCSRVKRCAGRRKGECP